MTTESFADQATEASKEQGTGFESGAVADKAQAQDQGQGNVEQMLRKLEKRLDDKDAFIDKLKSERRTDEDMLSKKDAEIQELREKLDQLGSTTERVDKALEELKSRREVNGSDKAEVNLDEVIEKATARMEENLSAKAIEAQQKENFSKVESAVKEAFGEGYLNALQERCAALNMSLSELDRLAKVSPDAAVKLLDLNGKKSAAPTTSSVNSSAFQQPAQASKPKTVMGFSSTKQDVAAWRAIQIDE